MSGCEFYADALVDLVEGGLEPGRAERVEAHLETCDECRASVEVIRAVRGAPAPMPEALEARIQAAVRGAPADVAQVHRSEPTPWETLRGWRRWALPVAAAAAVAFWIGANELITADTSVEPGQTVEVEAMTDYDPYGAWPGSDGELAGDLVLGELSVEELEALLEEMES